MMNSPFGRAAAVVVLSVALINVGFISSAQAGIVDTGALIATDRDADMAFVRSQLDRTEVRQQMARMGVDAAHINTRVAALNDSELHGLAQNMQHAPAGGDGVLAVLGVVFLVLLVLQLVGVIDVFKRAPHR